MSGWDSNDASSGGSKYHRQSSNNQRYSRGFQSRNSRDSGRQSNNWRASSQQESFASNPDDMEAINSWGPDLAPAKPKPTFQRRRRTDDDQVVQIQVPSSKVGLIIGRGGSKIRELQELSEAEIKIKRDGCDDESITEIEIIGLEEAVKKAQELIGELTQERQYGQYGNSHKSTGPEPEDPDTEQVFDWQAMQRTYQEETKQFWGKLPEIIKNFYREDPEVATMSPAKVSRIRAENNNTTVGFVFDGEHTMKIPNPIERFEQCFGPYPEILQGIVSMGFEKPSPIQAQAWPVLLSGQDLIGIAQTGTGKTLAFLLPALIHIEGQITPRAQRTGPTVLVLAPTRELAQQIEKEVKKYNYKDMKVVCIYGGGSRREQVATCTGGVEIVIATPGRLSDLTVAGHIDLKSVSYLVLDEADRMLDLGFEPQIRKILLDIRPNRQTVMTSATWPPGVRRLAQSYTQDPIQVCVGSLDLAAVHSVIQTIVVLEDNDDVKYGELLDFFNSMDEETKVIVFCGKKARVNHLASELCLNGISCQTIHGDLDQCDREQALVDIANGAVQILIATDVAARGIDIADITHVINYDFPRNVEEYVHRVGRTGRAGRQGEAISFVTRGDWGNAKELIGILEEANQNIPEELYNMKERFEAYQERRQREKAALGGGRGGGGGGFRNRPRW